MQQLSLIRYKVALRDTQRGKTRHGARIHSISEGRRILNLKIRKNELDIYWAFWKEEGV